jgi:hypothetical protein
MSVTSESDFYKQVASSKYVGTFPMLDQLRFKEKEESEATAVGKLRLSQNKAVTNFC